MKGLFKLGISILFLSCLLLGCSKNEAITIDPFENIKITAKGWNKSGTVSIKKGKISYSGKDETIDKLIDSISYKLDAHTNLKNGDVITITFDYNTNYYDISNVNFKRNSYTYKVHDLHKKNVKVKSKKSTYVDEETGKTKTKESETYVIDGVEIPVAWNLSEEEMQEYISYVKDCEDESGVPAEETKKKIWMQGISETKTHRNNSMFKLKKYNNNASECYQAAYEYGNTSSQKYKIIPIIKNEVSVGYECVFKGK